MILVLAQNCWGTGPDVPAALKQAALARRDSVGQLNKEGWYALEFPDGTDFNVSPVDGSWSASARPERVAQRRKVPATFTDADLLGNDL